MDKVSVILPNYNHEKFLQKRIDSILDQSYHNFELIILDDASTDNSLQILEKYRNNPKVTHFQINVTNSGSPFAQWKKGIDIAKGDLIWIAESDDTCELNFLENLVPFFEKDNIALAFANTYYHNYITQDIKIAETNFTTGIYDVNKIDFLYNWFFNNSSFRISNASACLFRKSFVNQAVLDYIKTFRYSGDKFFWATILTEHPLFAFVELPLNIQSFHEKTTRYSKSLLSKYIRNEELIIIYEKFGFKNPKIKSFEWRKEYGKRLILSFYYSLKLRKGLSVFNLFKGILILRFNIAIWKRIYWNL